MSTIEVSKPWIKRHEISNAVDVSQRFYNAGEKEIKYITFSYLAYNAVNDVVACKASGKTAVNGKLTGPIPPSHQNYVTWDSMWFNPTVSTVVLTRMHIQFMDNTEEVIEGKDIVYMDDAKSMYYQNITLPEQKRKEEQARKQAEEQERRKKIEDAIKKLSSNETTTDGIKEVFLDYKDDEKTLIEILDKVSARIKPGYLIGDYIEKEYSSNKVFMEKAVALWKKSIANHQYCQFMPFSNEDKERKTQVKTYAEKVKKYEPAYTIPKKRGFISFM